MGIDHGKAQFFQRGGLEVLQHVVHAGFAGTKSFKQGNDLVLSHGGERCHEGGRRSKGVDVILCAVAENILGCILLRWKLQGMITQWSSRVLWTSACVGVLLSVYVVGLGPAVKIHDLVKIPWVERAIEVFYAPLVWVHERSDLARDLLDWYVGLWI
jgi:hypothetical protein